MAVNRFTIGQRVRVVRVGDWNGTPPLAGYKYLVGQHAVVVRQEERDTITVMFPYWQNLGTLQFLPDELEMLDNTSGDSVE